MDLILVHPITDVTEESIITSGAYWINKKRIMHLQTRMTGRRFPYVIITLDNGEVIKASGEIYELLELLDANVMGELDADKGE